MAPFDRFKAERARSRVEALVRARRDARVRAAGGDDLVPIEEAADILGYSVEHTARMFRDGVVPGAFLEKRRWWVRRRSLWAYTSLNREHEVVDAVSS